MAGYKSTAGTETESTNLVRDRQDRKENDFVLFICLNDLFENTAIVPADHCHEIKVMHVKTYLMMKDIKCIFLNTLE